MPIFSNRSIFNRLREIAHVIGTPREMDIQNRLSLRGDEAVAAEWEVVILSSLARVGTIKAIEQREGVSNPDILFTCSETGQSILVEVTAISDSHATDKNPIDEFMQEVFRIGRSQKIFAHGAINHNIGYSKDRGLGNPIAAIPGKQDFVKFFRGPEFRSFIRDIKTTPHEPHYFRFEWHGGQSVLQYEPGQRSASGRFPGYRSITSAIDNQIVNRLNKKHSQIKRSGYELPALLFLCDNDCDAFKRVLGSSGTARVEADEIVQLYLNGRPHHQCERFVIQQGLKGQSSRISGVVVLSVEETVSFPLGPGNPPYSLKYSFITNTENCAFPLDTRLSNTIASAIQHIPPVGTMPINAKCEQQYPWHFGGGEMTMNTVRISLLTLQRLLAGEISYDTFQQAHGILAQRLSELSRNGKMISALKIEKCPDEDDDWVTFTFDENSPDHLFEKE